MRKVVAILLGLVLLWLPTLCAEEMTATITAYNAVEMSGDVPQDLWATFLNENHSKGQVTEGKTAVLTIGTWPNCTITGVTVYLHSNKNGGAGILTVSVDNIVCVTQSGSLADWVGQYSTETVAYTQEGSWPILYNQTLKLSLKGTENSLYIEAVTIRYRLAAPEPYCVRLIYPTDTKLEARELCEDGIGSGIVLPACDMLTDGQENWSFKGWSTSEVMNTTSEPALMAAGTIYYPRHDDRLWAVYSDGNVHQRTPQCTTRTDHEVIIVERTDSLPDHPEIRMPDYVMVGAVQTDEVLAYELEVDTTADGTAWLHADYIPYEYRYQFLWNEAGDSVRIYHPASKSYIGWSSTKLSSNNRPWQVVEGKRHSYYFYHDMQADGSARTLWRDGMYDEYLDEYLDFFTSRPVYVKPEYEALIYFDVSELPYGASVIHWCSNPFGVVNVQAVMGEKEDYGAAKMMYDGQIVIVRDGKMYTLTGARID